MAKYVRRGHRLSVGQNVTQNDARIDSSNRVTVNNYGVHITERDIQLDDLQEVDEPNVIPPELCTPAPVNSAAHLGGRAAESELWTVPLLKMIIAAINNAYFNAKLIDNVILVDDLKAILEAVIHKRVEITLAEVEPKCSKCEKLVIIRDIAKITVLDSDKTQQNFKYAYNAIYESLINDFHINMNRVYVNPIV